MKCKDFPAHKAEYEYLGEHISVDIVFLRYWYPEPGYENEAGWEVLWSMAQAERADVSWDFLDESILHHLDKEFGDDL